MTHRFHTFTKEELDVLAFALDYMQDEPAASQWFATAHSLHAEVERSRLWRQTAGGTSKPADNRQLDIEDR